MAGEEKGEKSYLRRLEEGGEGRGAICGFGWENGKLEYLGWTWEGSKEATDEEGVYEGWNVGALSLGGSFGEAPLGRLEAGVALVWGETTEYTPTVIGLALCLKGS